MSTTEERVGLRAASTRWWRYAVLRGPGIPADLNGRWLDLEHMPPTLRHLPWEMAGPSATLEATDRWEQRDDGQVAVVYEWTRRTPMPAPAMLIWKKDIPGLYDVQEPTGAMHFDLTQGQVRSLALENRWAVEYPDGAPPAQG